ncbi:Uma2 family endonuclease [Pirellulaceae bacterium SH449]
MSSTLHLSLREYDHMVKVGAFETLDRKVELIRGEIVQMNPAGPVHDDFVAYLTTWSAHNSDPGKTLITSQTGVDLPDQDSRPEPDIFWVHKRRYRDRHPGAADVQLAIEVADSSLVKDLVSKRLLYAEAKIVEYWIVDCRSNCVHVFREPDGVDYQIRFVVTARDQLGPLVAPNAKLDLHDLFAGD